VFGLAGVFGSVGILFANLFGGWLYDVWTKSAPFFIIGACNLLVLGFALYVRNAERRAASR
jgi:F0F1-type ATP synthase assembly protein I